MNFKEYPSLINHYNKDIIEKAIEDNVKIINTKFVIQEKIHGANITISVFKDGSSTISKRTGVLKESENFFGLKEYIDNDQTIQKVIVSLGKICSSKNFTKIDLHGEFFGDGINKGVRYGSKRIKFFDVSINNILQPIKVFESLIDEVQTSFNCTIEEVPSLGIVYGIRAALDYDTEFNTLLNNIPDNMCEGIVIKPYDKVIYTKDGSLFYIKKKNNRFKEIEQEDKKPINKEEYLDINEFRDKFKRYITVERVNNLISKRGDLTEKNFNSFIKEFIEDARKDFMKDNGKLIPKEILNDIKKMKQVFNVGTLPYMTINRRYLLND